MKRLKFRETTIREALITDLPRMQVIRHSIRENVLSGPALVTGKAYLAFLAIRGKGWVCERDNQVIGFAIVDLKENNVWALLVQPEYEGWGRANTKHALVRNCF